MMPLDAYQGGSFGDKEHTIIVEHGNSLVPSLRTNRT